VAKKSKKKSKRNSKKSPLLKALKRVQPLVGIVMGSDSDLRIMKVASDVLKDFGVLHEVRILSAHRTPEAMLEYAAEAYKRGLKVLIAGAGGAAHLPGMLASATVLPVIGVPVNITKLDGIDAFLSIVQMPKGVPVATVAIDNAANAALLALRILGTENPSIVAKLLAYKKNQMKKVKAADNRLDGRHTPV
jgi:phosphoribosylaminoimidazole carboxylase PurE protein